MSSSVLDGRVLVLNSSWMPINVTSVFDAVCKVFQNSAVFVDPETYATYDFEGWVEEWDDALKVAHMSEDDFIRCVRFGLRVPEVIICSNYSGSGFISESRNPKFSRRNVFSRDRNTCQYCGKKGRTEDLNIDHVIPKSKGGPMSWTNIVLSCIKCNDKKADRTPKEAGMRLISVPRVPSAAEVRRPFGARLRKKIGTKVPNSWEAFLGKMYWNVELHD